MTKKHFYIEDYYILTKNDDNWDAVKWMLDLPICERTNKKPSKKYKEYKRVRREIWNKKRLTDEQKERYIKKLDEERTKTMDEIVTPTHRTFLRAFGDLICERGSPPSISAPAIENRFMELAIEEYDKYVEDQIQIISKQIEQSKGKDKDKEELRDKEIKDLQEEIERLKTEHLNKVKQMNEGSGLKALNRIISLNNWLNKNRPGIFIKKIGENYKLLIYYAVASDGEIEYFCSDKNRDKFLEIIDEMERKREQFEGIEYIKFLENVLKPSPMESIEYFRDLGPLSVHFEKGWMYRRREVDELEGRIENTDSNNVQLLTGYTASGKTVIVRNIGYDLLKDGWKVYEISIYDLVDESKRRSIRWCLDYLENIANKVLVIIEDVHRESDEFPSFLEWILNKYSKTRFLLTAREPFDIGLMREEKSVFKRCEREKLEKEIFPSIADFIITTYKNKQEGERKEDLDKFAPKDRRLVKEVADEDLWLLAYALDAWTLDKGINMDMIYDKIKEDISDLENEFKTKHGLYGVSEVLLTLVPFSLYEIGVSKSFLKSNYGVIKTNPDKRDKLLDKLVEYDKIIEENGLYLISHSTHARLYLETALSQKGEESYKNLLWEIINRYKDDRFSVSIENYPLEMIKAYLRTRPINYREVIRTIRNGHDVQWSGSSKIKGEKPLVSISKLLKDEEIHGITISLVKDANNLEDIYSYLLLFDTAYKQEFISEADVANVLNEIGVKYFLALIEKASKTLDVIEISFIIREITCMGDNNFKDRFVKELDPSIITKNLKIEDISLLSLFYILYYISKIDENAVFKFEAIVQNVVKSKKELDNISEVLKGLFQNEFLSLYLPIRLKLLSLLPAEDLLFLIKKEDNFLIIDRFIFHIRDGLIAIFDSEKSIHRFTKVMAQKIDSAENIHKIIQLLCRIAAHNSTYPYYVESIKTKRKREDMFSKIIEKMDVKSFKSKVDEVDKLLLPLIPYLNCIIGESENIKFVLEKLKLPTEYDKEKIKLKINSLSRTEAREKINYFYQVWYNYLNLPDILNDELFQILPTQNNSKRTR